MWHVGLGAIQRVQCAKVTAKCVWPVNRRGCREARVSCWGAYYETWEQAHGAMLAKAERELQSARLMLARAQGEYGRIKGMKPPADAVEVQP
jgi:hypothetical protein